MHRDDLEQVEAGLAIYDALFRWARDARDDVHNWTPEAA
ncbi:MAG: sulfurtransferase, partial [Pseudomonadota bacterium]